MIRKMLIYYKEATDNSSIDNSSMEKEFLTGNSRGLRSFFYV